jgi:hypothetical protein
MQIELTDGNICARRVDSISDITYSPGQKRCQIWYGASDGSAEPFAHTSHTLDEPEFRALLNAWESGTSVTLKETAEPKSAAADRKTQRGLFEEAV